MDKLRLQLMGPPCTKWSCAQTKDRETVPSGIGWELFLNCVIAREKFRPDFYICENNKSMAAAIRDQIDRELPDATRYLINSALVSAQNRERYYWTNAAGISMPEDRGILLADVLESGNPFGVNGNEKSYALTSSYYKGCPPGHTLVTSQRTQVAEPVRIAEIGTSGGQGQRVYSIEGKSPHVRANGRQENIAIPADAAVRPVYLVENGQITIKDKQYPINLPDGYYIIRKLTVTECCRLQTLPDWYFDLSVTRKDEIVLWCQDAPLKGVRIPLQIDKQDTVTNIIFDFCGMEAVSLRERRLIELKSVQSTAVIEIGKPLLDFVLCIISDGKDTEVQRCLNALATVSRATMLPVTMSIGSSIDKLQKKCSGENCDQMKLSTILTLTKEIMSHLILPFYPIANIQASIGCFEASCFGESRNSLTLELSNSKTNNMRLISDTQCYRSCGNGWTAEVIIHLLRHALRGVPIHTPIEVLSLYDGIGTGRYCLDRLGYRNVTYYAHEIDPFAIKVAQSNYPDIIQCGDAFAVRDAGWGAKRSVS